MSQGETSHEREGPGATARTVLVVDDEPVIRMLIVDVLEEAGHVALEAADGRSALAVVESEQPIDLLVTDVGLPGAIDGREVAARARAARPGLKVLFVTGFGADAAFGDGPAPEGTGIIVKPFSVSDLSQRIEDMIAR